jgi:hypothetical protein
MAQRTTPSLAFSEYVSTDSDNSVQVWRARLQVIEASKRVYPRFLKKLLTDVFPLYCRLAKAGKLGKWRINFEKALWGRFSWEALTEDGGLKTALLHWAAQFHAEAPWLLVGALRTMWGWYRVPAWRDSLAWDRHHGRRDRPTTGKTFEFSHPGWEVQALSWPAYCQDLRNSFEKRLLEYEKETRELAKSRGLVRARRKYSPDNFEWFVLYQFAGVSSTTIVARYAVGQLAEDVFPFWELHPPFNAKALTV